MTPSTRHTRNLFTLSILAGLLLLGGIVLDIWKHAPTLQHTTGHLTKRAKDTPYGKDKLSFNQAVDKGNQWVCNLPNDVPVDRQTKFTQYDQLQANGWADSGDHPDPASLDELKELSVSCVPISYSLDHEIPSGRGALLCLNSPEFRGLVDGQTLMLST